MKRLQLWLTLLVVMLSGCIVSRPGSQEIEIGPGYIRPAYEESNQIMREATGDPRWGDRY